MTGRTSYPENYGGDNEWKIGSLLTPALYSAFQHQTAILKNDLLGMSVEPVTQNEQQVQLNDVSPSNVEFVSKILNNFVNYITSFVQNVPLSIVQTWYSNFQRCGTDNPNFWKQQN
ncbi:unnamed protein product [Adineta steineri]|uniref:Hikeshi-like C-terminal domain-containing protein n=1 Tax=Adineta steineri TaxID=433720 RepID=A0A815CIC1_9BILA|nr:unnamed protein product [Adineta steineri]CAF1284145.1 unnamed protein product [Adineta steineri]CAF1488639.1 unnamed protein product [Adineta steineri]CAF1640821.1 unnamed protein product [Adineta steineri]